MKESTYQQAKQQAVRIDLQNTSWLEFRGKDRNQFLHNLCTNNVRELLNGAGCEAFFTNVHGKVLGFGVLFAEEDCISLLTEAGQTNALLAHLDKYLIREDVQFNSTSGKQQGFLIVGPNTPLLMRELGAVQGVSPWSFLGFNNDLQVKIYQLNCFNVPAVYVRCPVPLSRSIASHLDGAGIPCVESEVAEVLRIENGFPRYGIDISKANLPQEVDRNSSAISFTKGCYLGQETVARIDALGHVNRRLCRLSFTSQQVPPTVGTELMSDKTNVGHITSSIWSIDEGALGMAYVRRGHDHAGNTLRAGDDVGTVI